MTGTIHQRFRQRLLQEFIGGTNIDSVYLVFSHNTGRTLANTEDTSEVPALDRIHGDSTPVTARYAVRLDTNDRMQYAREKKSGDTGTEVLLNSVNYIVSTDISSSLDELWTNAYFNAPLPPSLDEDFNIVSVIINLDSTADTIDASTFSNAMFANAEIVMMSRPGTKNIGTDIVDNQFPGLIRF